jgi:hypothetical protein
MIEDWTATSSLCSYWLMLMLSKNFLDVVFKEYLFSDFLQLISTYDNVIFRLNVPGMRFFGA